MSTRSDVLDDLVSQLDGLDDVDKATMRLLLPIDQENSLPYIGVIPSEEVVITTNGYDTRYKMDVVLSVKTKEDSIHIESLIDDIKTLIYSIDLGDDVNSCKLIGVQEVEIKDKKPIRYSAVGILLELLYTENHGTTYPAIESRTLTEPTGYAHYKLYETLTSGSTSIQSLGTNIYDNHSVAAMTIPAGSGSISIGSVENIMNEDDGAVYEDELIENHHISFEIRCHSAFITEYSTIPQPFIDRSVMDNVSKLIWGTAGSVLGNNYRTHTVGPILYNQTFESTLGASMVVVIEIVEEYT